jgi:hypothetical protein
MSDELADDDSHPIPRVRVVDYVRTIEGGGAGYGLVIARPIAADQRSMHRLATKLGAYVEDFFSDESREKQGTPAPGRMWILVNIHRDSSPAAFEMIKDHIPWMHENGINLTINAIDENGSVVETVFESPDSAIEKN